MMVKKRICIKKYNLFSLKNGFQIGYLKILGIPSYGHFATIM